MSMIDFYRYLPIASIWILRHMRTNHALPILCGNWTAYKSVRACMLTHIEANVHVVHAENNNNHLKVVPVPKRLSNYFCFYNLDIDVEGVSPTLEKMSSKRPMEPRKIGHSRKGSKVKIGHHTNKPDAI